MLRKLASTRLAMDATTLTLRLCKAQIRLECPLSLTRTTPLETIQKFPPLVQWLDTLDTQTLNANTKDKIVVDKITIQSIDEFGSGKIGFLKFKVSATHTQENKQLPGTVFLRGGSVAMLIILRTSVGEQRKLSFQDDSFVLLTEQPRMAAPMFNMVEIPAGMLDGKGEFAGTAAREIHEETGLVIDSSELIELTPLDGPQGLFPSVGACDERVHFFACEKTVTDEQLDQLRGKLSGLRDDGELITLRLVRMCDLWQQTHDMKATTAMYLWDRWVHKQCQ